MRAAEREGDKECEQLRKHLPAIIADGTPGEWQTGTVATSSRNIQVGGLVSGQLYAFRVRAVGGSTGYSDWSNSTTHRAM